jgi:hypothetical protein
MEQSSKVSWRIRAILPPSGQTEVPFSGNHNSVPAFWFHRVPDSSCGFGCRPAIHRPLEKSPACAGLRASGMDRGPIPLGSAAAILFHQWNPRHGPNARHGTAKNIKVRQEPYQRNCVSGKHGGFWKCQVRVPSTIAVKPTSAFASPSQPSMTRRARACSQWPGTSSPKPTRPNARASRRHQWRKSTPFRPAPTNAYGRSGTV